MSIPSSVKPIHTDQSREKKDKQLPLKKCEIFNKILQQHGYSIIRLIGSGNFSKVLHANSENEHREVAIKCISKTQTPIEYIMKFLPREISVVRHLNHPNVINYYRCIETTQRVYIIMQYANNGSLFDLIKTEKQLSENLARQIYKQLIDAIEYCHNTGVVHRDIKCENILFNQKMVLKLIDFGFSRKYVDTISDTKLLSETYCGSLAYACPQILMEQPYDPHFADLWGSGVVLYAMLYGRLPFDDSSMSKLSKQIQNKLNFTLPAKFHRVTKDVNNLISAILSTNQEISINQIRLHSWMLNDQEKLSNQ